MGWSVLSSVHPQSDISEMMAHEAEEEVILVEMYTDLRALVAEADEIMSLA